MVSEKQLMWLCLLCSVLGIILLFVGIEYSEAEIIPIKDVKIGGPVSLEGKVSSRYYNGEHLFFTLKDSSGKIKVVVFESTIKRLRINPEEIKNGMSLRVVGSIKEYHGELEILPERIYFD